MHTKVSNYMIYTSLYSSLKGFDNSFNPPIMTWGFIMWKYVISYAWLREWWMCAGEISRDMHLPLGSLFAHSAMKHLQSPPLPVAFLIFLHQYCGIVRYEMTAICATVKMSVSNKCKLRHVKILSCWIIFTQWLVFCQCVNWWHHPTQWLVFCQCVNWWHHHTQW